MSDISKINAWAFLLFFPLSFTSCESRTAKLRREEDKVINLIEAHRLQTGKLPASLTELGIPQVEEGPLYYQRKSATTYEVWFGRSLGESETYSSRTKKWEK